MTEKQARERLRAHFAALPPDARKEIKKLRDAIRAAAPAALVKRLVKARVAELRAA